VPGSILIADDDTSVRKLLALLAQRAGYEVDEAADGTAALERLRGRDYLVLLLDLMMPDVDGDSIVERLRSSVRRPAVIVVVAYPATGIEGRFEPDVVDAVIHEPYDVDMISTVIMSLAGAVQQKSVDDTVRTRTRKQQTAAEGFCPYCGYEFLPPPAGDNAYIRTAILIHLARCIERPELKDDRDLQRLVDKISDSLEKHFHPDVN